MANAATDSLSFTAARNNGLHEMSDNRFDYIIVGAGSAGCVLANRLTASGKHRVLLLEAGSRDWNPIIRVPIGEALTVGGSIDWKFKTEPEPNLCDRVVPLPRGKVLGGSSSINGQLYVRGHQLDYDEWSAMGCKGWSFNEVLPFFKRSEHWAGGSDAYRGGDGPLKTAFGRFRHPIYQAFLDAGKELNYPLTTDCNGADQEGFSWTQYTQTHAFPLRCSSATAYLHPAENRQNLSLQTKAQVTRLLFDGVQCTGVEYMQAGRSVKAYCNAEVILSAGTYQSPQILMLSGIGDADKLALHGIDTVSNLPSVGQNLTDHFGSMVQHRCKITATYHSLRNPFRFLGALGQLLFARSGPLSVFPMNAQAYLKTDPSLDRPDVKFYMFPVSVDNSASEPRYASFNGYNIHWGVMRPFSKGVVELHSADPFSAPKVLHNYLKDPRDIATHRAAFKIARKIHNTQAFEQFRGAETDPGAAFQSDEDIDNYVRSISLPQYHPVGTCQMGKDKKSVVDPELRVWGVKGLRIVDASIMPRLIGGNTNGPTIMIAEKASEMILESSKSRV